MEKEKHTDCITFPQAQLVCPVLLLAAGKWNPVEFNIEIEFHLNSKQTELGLKRVLLF